jgi:hypothetical protein
MTDTLDRLLELLKTLPPMTEGEKEEQRRSFVYGNSSISNPSITRELVAEVANGLERGLSEVEVELSKREGIPLDGYQRERLVIRHLERCEYNQYLSSLIPGDLLWGEWVRLMEKEYSGQKNTRGGGG